MKSTRANLKAGCQDQGDVSVQKHQLQKAGHGCAWPRMAVPAPAGRDWGPGNLLVSKMRRNGGLRACLTVTEQGATEEAT